MDWRRGLPRLWIVGSIAWVLAVLIAYGPFQKIVDPIGNTKNFKVVEARNAGYSDEEIVSYLRKTTAVRFNELALAPPLFLLGLGFGGLWVAKGLNSPRPN
jgi:hypothetical protein